MNCVGCFIFNTYFSVIAFRVIRYSFFEFKGTPSKVLLAFSAYTNGLKLLNTHQGADTLCAINGLRLFSITWIVLGHTYAYSYQRTGNFRARNQIATTFYVYIGLENRLEILDITYLLQIFAYVINADWAKSCCCQGYITGVNMESNIISMGEPGKAHTC